MSFICVCVYVIVYKYIMRIMYIKYYILIKPYKSLKCLVLNPFDIIYIIYYFTFTSYMAADILTNFNVT